MFRGVTLGALLLAACIDVHPFRGDAGTSGDGGPVGDGGTVIDGSTTCVSTGVHLNDYDPPTFDSNTNGKVKTNAYQFSLAMTTYVPAGLSIDGVPVLDVSSNTCNGPSELSVAIEPGGDSSDGKGTLSGSAPLSGNGILEFSTQWNESYGCGTATVVTHWLFFPDGRMVRHDTITSFEATAAATCNCSVPIATQSLVATGTFMRTAYPVLNGRTTWGDPSALQMPACLSWTTPSGSTPADHDLLVLGGASQVRTMAGPWAIFTAENVAGTLADGTTTYALVPHGHCADAATLLAPFAATAFALQLNGHAFSAPMPDGVFGSIDNGISIDQGDDALVEVPTGPAAPPGFTMALNFQAPFPKYEVRKNGRALASPEVFVRAHDNVALVWLRDSFGGCDQIVVHPSSSP